jgi:hypothetical protein
VQLYSAPNIMGFSLLLKPPPCDKAAFLCSSFCLSKRYGLRILKHFTNCKGARQNKWVATFRIRTDTKRNFPGSSCILQELLCKNGRCRDNDAVAGDFVHTPFPHRGRRAFSSRNARCGTRNRANANRLRLLLRQRLYLPRRAARFKVTPAAA